MLEIDREVAAERSLKIRTVETSMDDLSMFSTGQFDLVIQPVSTCYIHDVGVVYREVARVLRGGGLYISQHKQPTSLQASLEPIAAGNRYVIEHPCYTDVPLAPIQSTSLVREPGAYEYIHRWEQLLGLMCRAGFLLEDLVEPIHADSTAMPNTFPHRSQFLPPYVRIKARRKHNSIPHLGTLIGTD
jgi:SAM-dependent methyltransferase